MKPAFARSAPLAFALGLYAILSLVLGVACRDGNQGVFTYTLDDAYIHLAIAKNLGLRGVFGITPYQFSSSESSLLWGLILALLFKVTPHAGQSGLEFAPLVLNLLAGAALLVGVDRVIHRRESGFATLHPALAAFFLTATVLVTPLPWMTFIGMEHTLQSVLTLLFVAAGAILLALPEDEYPRGAPAALLALAPLVTAVRYEGVFPVAVVCLFLLLRRRFALALGVGALALLPLLIYGALSAHYGGLWLPNSVALKSSIGDPGMRRLLAEQPQPLCLVQLADRPYLLTLFVLSLVPYLLRLRLHRRDLSDCLWRPSMVHAAVFLACTVLSLQTSLQRPTQTGFAAWFFRYDAYLVALGLAAVALQLRDLAVDFNLLTAHDPRPYRTLQRQKLVLCSLLLTGAAATFVPRARLSQVIPQASHNIYVQQYQMAEFIRQAYPGEAVALNDIGAVNYKADIRCFDLIGLGSPEVARARYASRYTGGDIARLAAQKKVRIALVYRAWFEPKGLIPPNWRLVAQWTIPNNVICGADTVGFYAIDPAEAENLTRRFIAFSEKAPREIQRLYFVDVGSRK